MLIAPTIQLPSIDHGGELLAEGLAAPACSDVRGVRERAVHQMRLHVVETLDVLGAVRDGLAVDDHSAAGLRHERADALVLRAEREPDGAVGVSVLLTAVSSSHVVGMSASVRPAAAHRSLLMMSASVEKSFGAQ